MVSYNKVETEIVNSVKIEGKNEGNVFQQCQIKFHFFGNSKIKNSIVEMKHSVYMIESRLSITSYLKLVTDTYKWEKSGRALVLKDFSIHFQYIFNKT